MKRYDMKAEYNPTACEDQVKFTECADGGWVKYEDVVALQAQIDLLRRLGAAVCLEFPEKITEAQVRFMSAVSPLGVAGTPAQCLDIRDSALIRGFANSIYDTGELSLTDAEFVTKFSEEYINERISRSTPL